MAVERSRVALAMLLIFSVATGLAQEQPGDVKPGIGDGAVVSDAPSSSTEESGDSSELPARVEPDEQQEIDDRS